MRVLLTGVTGVLGEPLAARLAREPKVERLLTVARRPLPPTLASLAKIRHLTGDYRDPRVAAELGGVDVLVHAAFQPFGRDIEALRAVNVDGSIALHRAAAAAGIGQIVFISSAAAYGSHPDNPLPLPEAAPLRPNPESFYSMHKAEVERDLEQLAAANGGIGVLRIRPCILLGQKTDRGTRAIRRYYRRLVPVVRGDHWLWQFMHTDDAAEAITRAIGLRLAGALNIAGDGWLTSAEVAQVTGGRVLTMPRATGRAIPVLYRLHLSPIGRDRLVLARNPIVVSNERMRRATGFKAHSSERALRDFMSARRP